MSEEREAVATDGDAEELDDLLDLEADDTAEELEEPSRTEQQQPPSEPREPSSRARQIRAMRDRLRQEQEANRQLRQSVDQLLIAQRTQPAPDPYRAAEANRMEQERVATMMPHEQAAYYAAQAEQRMQGQYLRARVEVGDLIDKQAFQQLCRDEPYFRRMADQVEQALMVARQQGMNPTREALANQILATEVRQKTRRDADKQRRNGRAAIARETTRPGNGRSTVAPGRRPAGDDDAALDARLRSVTIGDLGW